MPVYTIPYDHTTLTFPLPDTLHPAWIVPRHVPEASDARAEIERTLARPLGNVSLDSFVGARRVAIAISDKSRTVPNDRLLPPLLDRLHALGIPRERITFLIAGGCHPPMAPPEYNRVLPSTLLRHYRVLSHDCDDQELLVYRGRTPTGTPVWVNRYFAEADLRIVVGNIEPHQFQGFTGGAKGAAIGLAGRATIEANHRLLIHPRARLGVYAGNPARQDVEAIGRVMGIHFVVNSILNQEKQIVRVLSGTAEAVMQAGVSLVQEICQVAVPQPFDLLIASAGGYPKDINLYQAQKALAHAALIVRPGGWVVLAAACSEGAGDAVFSSWMSHRSSLADTLQTFEREGFHLGPHKAFLLARDASRVRVRLVSEMQNDAVRRFFLTPARDVDSAVREALTALPEAPRVGIMPKANATAPVLPRG